MSEQQQQQQPPAQDQEKKPEQQEQQQQQQQQQKQDEKPEDKQEKKEDDESSSEDGEEGHDHEHDHAGHDHHDHAHDDKDSNKKTNRGEKKFKKAMTKLGMKPIGGINRVTIKKGKGLLLYIDDPEVLKSPNTDNSYIIFGEAKINDFAQNLAAQEAKQFKHPEKPDQHQQQPQNKPSDNKEEQKGGKPEEDLSEEGLNPEDIKTVMDHCKCTKPVAIKALRSANGDKVNAILQLSEN